jgi:hypothetical protein
VNELTSENLLENIDTHSNIFDEKFWSKLLEHTSQKARDKEDYESNIPEGKGIFSYKDLKRELALLYKKHLLNIKSKNRISQLNDEQFANYIERRFIDDFDMHIDSKLQYLINNDIVFIGMKVKCNSCGSNNWYSLNELKNKMLCKGCYSKIVPQLESKLYYRFNEILISNLRNDKGLYHGNYIVLRALLWLKRKCINSFLYQPSTDCSYIDGTELKNTDVDILAICDGKLIVGEAKCKATEFKEKEKQTLIWLGNSLKPDKIILAFQDGGLDEVNKKALEIKTKITEHSCEVMAYKAEPPKYMFGPLFGL